MSDLFGNVDFDTFWRVWPRRISRKPAEAKWSKLSPGQQKAALADVEKRNRMNAWPSSPKLIPHAATYLNQERWADEWEDEIKAEKNEGKPNSGPYIPQPSELEIKIPWAERLLNRLYVFWQYAVMGVDDVAEALQIKQDMLTTDVPAYLEDVEAEKITKQQAAAELADVFLSRLDLHYHKMAKARVLKTSRRTI